MISNEISGAILEGYGSVGVGSTMAQSNDLIEITSNDRLGEKGSV